MTWRQPGPPDLASASGPDQPSPTVAVFIAAAVVGILLAPLALPVAFCVVLLWRAYGGRAGRLALAGIGLLTLVLIGAGGVHASANAALARWGTFHLALQADGPAQRLLAVGWFVLGFGPVGPVFGVALGACWAWWDAVRHHGHTWHPREQRRLDAAAKLRTRRAERAARHLGRHPRAFAVLIDPPRKVDRRHWRIRWAWAGLAGPARVLCPTPAALALPAAVFGMPGSGKTTLIERLAWLAAREDLGFYVIDAKGTDPDLVTRVRGAYLAGRPAAQVLHWPAEPVNGWQCLDGNELVGRLIRVQSWSEPHYLVGGREALQLACCSPAGPPRTGEDLLGRLTVQDLADVWGDQPAQLARVDGLVEKDLIALRRRYSQFFHTIGGRFDGPIGFEAWDAGVFTVQGLGDADDARAAVAWLLADFEHYAGLRKPRRSRGAIVVVDEYSAIGQDGSDQVINLAQRGRDPGVAVIPSAQAFGDVGDERAFGRLVASCSGGLYVLRTTDGERITHLAGHEDRPAVSWRLRTGKPVDDGTLSMRRVSMLDPDLLGSAAPGEVDIIVGREQLHGRVIVNDQAATRAAFAGIADDAAAQAEAADDGALWAYLHRVADLAGELAGRRPELPAPRPQLPSPAHLPVRRSPASLPVLRIGQALAFLLGWVRAAARRVARRG